MKTNFSRRIFAAAVILLAAGFQLRAQTNVAAITPQAVLNIMQRVGDWQLANPAPIRPTGWIQSVSDVGIMALAGISGDPKYRDAMLAKGEAEHWILPQYQGRKYHADDQCYGQVCTELYFLYRDNRMIAPMREHFDWIMANPAPPQRRDPKLGDDQWNWCDALFMAPPSWLRLYAATGDAQYMNFAVTNWWRTTDYLYSTNDHLFYRDSTFFNKTETNGAKVFWSRGNGWVLAATVRMLQYLPMNHPDRPRFEQLFKDMADKILTLQSPDGLWRASLLDPEDYPTPEASGSAMFVYGLAWGVNQGLLDRAKYEPAVVKGWTALVGCVNADGRLTHVQPAGDHPIQFSADDAKASTPYGGGVFLLAGSEIYRMAVLEHKISGVLKVHNPANFRRDCETVGYPFETTVWPSEEILKNYVVMDSASSRILDSQPVSYLSPNGADNSEFPKLLFQVDLAPGETKTFYILDSSTLAAVPPPIVKTFARNALERHDDFAWESDRTAHRMFGKALETWAAEPLTSSGVDVWIKRTRSLIINEMYRTQDFFNATNAFQDDFKVGKTRGDGGLGVWHDGKLFVSGNWRDFKVITTGPIRAEFELTYDAWDAGGRKVSETKRISIDAGSNLSRVESTFSSDAKSPLQIGVGLAERPGENIILEDEPAALDGLLPSQTISNWQSSTAKGLFVQNQNEGWMTYWQPQDFDKGTTATAIVLPKGSVEMFTTDITNLPPEKTAAPTKTNTEGQPAIRNQLAIAPAEIGRPFVYYFGAGWDMSGDFPNAAAWNHYVKRFAERRDQPLRVTVGN